VAVPLHKFKVIHTYILPTLLTLVHFPAASPSERAQSPGVGPIQPQEIVAALPKEGITISDLMKVFTTRVGSLPGQTDKKEFIRLVKENSSYGPDKRLRQK
jgi:transcription initiation factor TFIIF subunit alpha